MGFSDRVPNPFPATEWAKRAYQNGAYLSVTTGLEFDYETGSIKTKLRFTDKVLEGSPAEILTNRGFQEGIGTIETEEDRIDMAFMIGYNLAQLGIMKIAKVVSVEGSENG